MGGLTDRVLQSGRALADTFRNRNLRRLQLAWIGSIFGTWSYYVALVVYAYDHGGAKAVALISILRMIPAAILSPFLATLADRFRRRLVMVGADLVRAGLMGAGAAVIALDGPVWAVYTIATLTTVTSTAFHPAQAALLPALARTPEELTTANVASSTLESVGGFFGPAVGGFLLAATSAPVVFAVNGGSFLWSALLVIGIRVAEPTPERAADSGAKPSQEITEGFRTIFRDRDLLSLVSLYSIQTIVAGALGVLIVVTALNLLNGGPEEVGLLDAATGIGGLIGSLVALALAARGRLAADFGLGLGLFGALALIGVKPTLAVAIAALVVLGIGNTLVDIASITLLQRTVPNEVLGRVIGAVEGVLLAALGLGAVAAPLLVDALGARAAIVVVGAVLPAVMVLAWPRLRRLDAARPAAPLVAILRRVEILAPLPPVALERLAEVAHEIRAPAGSTVIRKGEPGDRFYVVGDGELEIEGKTFGPGSSFGEIALLRDVPRTATVTARTDVVLHALERDDFLAAVTGNEPSNAAANAVIAQRLGELRADLTTEAGAT